MAVKIVRQPRKIAVLGAPTSAAALAPGHEAGPSALRSAGLISRLQEIGYDVLDLGDDPLQVFRPDEDNPRTRNLPAVVKSLEAFKPKVEQAVKSGALPLILGGDCSIALATVAGVRRYVRNLGMIYMDRDADLHTPASTASGSVDGMVVSHLIGRGAPELMRPWGKPPLVRETELVLFGIDRLDAAEEEWLKRSLLPRYMASDVQRVGALKAARQALEQIHASQSDFILHFDVDTVAHFPFTNYSGKNGLSLDESRETLTVFFQQERLAAVELTAYNPTGDSDGAGARLIINLIADALRVRLEMLSPKQKTSVVSHESSAASVSEAPAAFPAIPPPYESAPGASAEAGGMNASTAVPSPTETKDEPLP